MTQSHDLPHVVVAAVVADALARGQHPVALETTVVAHAFAPPDGLALALECERRVRAAGAVPATIGILAGRVVVGLDGDELTQFADGRHVRKVGPRDLASCISDGADGALTVGATLAISRLVGIHVMSTGGLGGVHRDFHQTLDVSADLAELVRTRAIVVCSGIKSILDVNATVELLETLGVPTVGWRTDTLPFYYQAASDLPTSARADDAKAVAAIAEVHWELGFGGVLLARPPTLEIEVQPLVAQGLQEAGRCGISGQAMTPFLLGYLDERTQGRTVAPHRQLILDNAALAGEVAAQLGDIPHLAAAAALDIIRGVQ